MTVPPTIFRSPRRAGRRRTGATTAPVEALRANFEAAASAGRTTGTFRELVARRGDRRGTHRAGGRTSGRSVLYLHGGGYAIGSPTTGRTIARLALAARTIVFSLDYRLAPENPCPAAIDDAVNAYRSILDNGAAPARLAVVGRFSRRRPHCPSSSPSGRKGSSFPRRSLHLAVGRPAVVVAFDAERDRRPSSASIGCSPGWRPGTSTVDRPVIRSLRRSSPTSAASRRSSSRSAEEGGTARRLGCARRRSA